MHRRPVRAASQEHHPLLTTTGTTHPLPTTTTHFFPPPPPSSALCPLKSPRTNSDSDPLLSAAFETPQSTLPPALGDGESAETLESGDEVADGVAGERDGVEAGEILGEVLRQTLPPPAPLDIAACRPARDRRAQVNPTGFLAAKGQYEG